MGTSGRQLDNQVGERQPTRDISYLSKILEPHPEYDEVDEPLPLFPRSGDQTTYVGSTRGTVLHR